jgi:hypothetical protein
MHEPNRGMNSRSSGLVARTRDTRCNDLRLEVPGAATRQGEARHYRTLLSDYRPRDRCVRIDTSRHLRRSRTAMKQATNGAGVGIVCGQRRIRCRARGAIGCRVCVRRPAFVEESMQDGQSAHRASKQDTKCAPGSLAMFESAGRHGCKWTVRQTVCQARTPREPHPSERRPY